MFALPNLGIFNESEGNGKNTVNYMPIFSPTSQDAKYVFIQHMIFLVIYMHVFILWTLPHHYKYWPKKTSEPSLPLSQVTLKLLSFHVSSATIYYFAKKIAF